MWRAIALGALVIGGCVYDYGALGSKRIDASGSSGHSGSDGGSPDSAGARADGAAGVSESDAPSSEVGGTGGSSGIGGASGRQNGAGCTIDGDCSSSHCVKAAPSDAAGICCDGIPGECTTCSNGYRVPLNDDTLIGCHACKAGAPTPYSGPVDVGNGMQAVCLEGAQYQEPATGPCARKGWTIASTPPCDATCLDTQIPPNAIDGDLTTRFTTGHPQGSLGPETIVLTFPAALSASGLWLFSGAPDDGPAAYRVEYSVDGTTFTAFNPAATGAGARNLSIVFPEKTTMHALRITQTGTKPLSWWSVAEMNLLDCVAN